MSDSTLIMGVRWEYKGNRKGFLLYAKNCTLAQVYPNKDGKWQVFYPETLRSTKGQYKTVRDAKDVVEEKLGIRNSPIGKET